MMILLRHTAVTKAAMHHLAEVEVNNNINHLAT
jgi:hypothetical protein